MRVAVVVPSLGAPSLGACLEALRRQTRPADRVVVILSGGARAPLDPALETVVEPRRLGFACGVNRGFERVAATSDAIAVLNDDAAPDPRWLETLAEELHVDASLASVQGTVTDAVGAVVDGRGIALDRFGLPVQLDRGRPAEPEPEVARSLLGVSATAALYRTRALSAVTLRSGAVFDPSFDCYHEDVDLALRLRRAGLTARWCPNARCRHLGSATGARRVWRHPYWLLLNRWRVLAGNLDAAGFFAALPRLARGEIRALAALTRTNPRALLVAPAAWLAALAACLAAARRDTTGPRLRRLPEGDS